MASDINQSIEGWSLATGRLKHNRAPNTLCDRQWIAIEQYNTRHDSCFFTASDCSHNEAHS
jgi:hypothetical protein